MANEWTYAALAAWETAARGNDSPLLINQSIPANPDVVRWSEEAGGAIGSTDRTLAANPAARAFDGFCNVITKHDSTNDDIWYLVFDFGIGGIDFDVFSSIGDNWGTLLIDALTLELDNGGVAYPTAPSSPDGTFANVVSIPLVATPSDDTRRMVLDLDHTGASATYRYSGVRYARLKFDKSGTNITPEIAEIFLGRSYQLKHTPQGAFDKTSLHDERSDITRTKSGINQLMIYAQGRFELSADLLASEDDPIDAIIAWFKSSGAPLIWIWQPTTSPELWHFMTRSVGSLQFPADPGGWTARTTTIGAVEQGPEEHYLKASV